MSLTRHCDYEPCTATDDALRIHVSFDGDGAYDFCTPEHVVMWLFAHDPSIPLWYGPKVTSEERAAEYVGVRAMVNELG